MKRLKKEREKKALSLGVKIAICACVGILVAVGVCTGLWMVNRVTGYREAKDFTEDILKTKVAVEQFLGVGVGEDGITDENKKVFNEFVSAVEKSGEYLESLSATGVLKNEIVNEKYREAKAELEKLVKAKDLELKLMELLEDGDISVEDLTVLKNMGDYLKMLAEDIEAYRAKVSEFNTKYENVKGANKTSLDNDYAALVAAGDELSKKYATIELDKVLGMSRADILGFYGKIEELDSYLADKK